MEMIRKDATVAVSSDLEYVLSDGSEDRYGDIVEPGGWDVASFMRHPVALFGHDKTFILGGWTDVRVKGGKLLAKLKLAARGTSARIDEVIGLAEQGFLNAVSVGFMPLEAEPLDRSDPYGPQRYKRQELLECSVVSVPANRNALRVAKGMNISRETIDLVFGEHAGMDQETRRRGITGEHAAPHPFVIKGNTMTLSDQIVALQDEIRSERDDLGQFTALEGFDIEESRTMAQAITAKETRLAGLREVEGALAAAPVPALRTVTPMPTPQIRPPLDRMPHKDTPLGDYVLRAHVVNALSKVTQRDRNEILQERYGDLPTREFEYQRKVFQVVTRAASAPATTTGAGWADTLVQTSIGEFIQTLTADSVFPGLSSRGIRTGFGRSGTISFPGRSSTPASVAGAFVAQGAPIPVKQALLSPTTLGIKKLGVITTFTREIAEHSTPDIEDLLRRFITEDTSAAIDAVLVSNSAATAIAPAGIRNGVSTTTVTAGGGFAALVGDVKALTTALVTGSNGNLRSPVWLMNPIQATAIALTQNAGGDFVFAAGINSGTLAGYPVLQSTTVTAGMIILVDAADFVSVTGDEMRFDVSDQATLHMEDTTPLPIATGAQGSGVLATPTRSLWQTDSLGLRMICDMNWALLRTGTVAWTSSVTW